MPSPFMLTGLDQVRSKWGWFVALGIAMVIIGAIAIGWSWVATLTAMIVFGWMLMFTGVAEAIGAFYARDWGGFFLHLLGAVLDIVVGFLFLTNPFEGAAVLTLVLACFFFVGGVFRIVASLTTQFPGWMWSLVGGVINVVLALLLWNQWPVVAFWFIGFCVGLELIFRGWFWVMLGMGLKQLPKAA